MKLAHLAFLLGLSTPAAAFQGGPVFIDFSFEPGPDGVLGTPDDIPITNNLGTGGELGGNEFGPLGILFSTPDLQLSIGCASGAGNPDNCLGADAVSNDDFDGLLLGVFDIGGVPATVATLDLDDVNDGSTTTLYDAQGSVIAVYVGDVSYSGPTPVARFEAQLVSSALLTVQFDQLSGGPTSYCTAGTSASGCTALLSSTGDPSATAPSGFDLIATTVEGAKDGIFFLGTNGRQANPWGNGTSYRCVVPPVKRLGLLTAVGTNGSCDGVFTQDLNALWCPICPAPAKNPGAGALVQAQLWYRDPFSTDNQTTAFSDAIEFYLTP